MKALFSSMFWQMLKLNAQLLGLALLTSAVLYRIGWGGVAGPIGSLLFITAFMGPMETSRKLPLMLSFPYSRNRLLLLTGITNWVGGLLAATSITIFYGLFFYFTEGDGEGVHPFQDFWSFFSLKGVWNAITADPQSLASFLFGGSLAALFFFLTTNSQNLTKKQQSVFYSQAQKSQFKLLLIFYAACALLFFLAINSSFLMMAFLTIPANYFSAALVSSTWVFSPPRKRKWLAAGAAVGLAQALLLFSFSLNCVNSGQAKLRIQSAEFLGIVGPEASPAFARAVVAQPIEPDVAQRLAKLLRPARFPGGIKAHGWDARTAPVGFREMIAHQDDFGTISILLSLYDPKSMGQEDLLYLFEKAKFKEVPDLSAWMIVPLSEDLLFSFLRSKEEAKVGLALSYIEFHPSEKFVEPVAQLLRSELPGNLIPRGILTLSVLLGKKLDYRTYLAQVAVGAKRSFFKIDCTQESRDALLALQEKSQEAKFNRCVRENAIRFGRPQAVEHLKRWNSLPLNDHEVKMQRRADRIKD